MHKKFRLFLLMFAGITWSTFLFTSCNHDDLNPPVTGDTLATGYDFLQHVTGIYGGPVQSGTLLGDFPDWQMDLRPISSSQVSMKSELDKSNDIFMSFFVGEMDGKRSVFFRNGGYFAGMQRVSYLYCDSVNTLNGNYYRFVDAKAGPDRVRSEITFRNDSMLFKTYVNNYFHFLYSAKRLDTTFADTAKQHFNYPQNVSMKNFTGAFDSRPDAVFYTFTGDPYPESEQPYLGNTNVHYSFDASITADTTKNVLVIISAQPLFSGFTFNPANLKYRTRYVLMKANEFDFGFTYMHPGHYYLNLLYDVNGDLVSNSGDYVSYPFDVPFTLSPQGSVNTSAVVNVQVP